jgi:hypothetical protein
MHKDLHGLTLCVSGRHPVPPNRRIGYAAAAARYAH